MQRQKQANQGTPTPRTLEQPYTPGHIDGLFDPRTLTDLAMMAAMGVLLIVLIIA